MKIRVERVACLVIAVSAGCVELPRSASATSDEALLDASLLVQDGGARRPPTADGPPASGCWSEPGAGDGVLPAGDGGLLSGGGASGAPGPAGVGAGAAKPRRPEAASEIVITELMADPALVADTAGEWIELHNPSSTTTLDLAGCTLDDGGAQKPVTDALLVRPGGFVTLARSATAGFVPDLTLSFSLANEADAIAVVCDAVMIDRVAYGVGFPLAPGVSMALDPAAFDAASNDEPGAWCLSPSASAGYGEQGTPGAANPPCHGEADSDAGR